ncbi:Response regulator receiver domain-containing protein [Polaromonas sp. JS666]|nr:Response regulator receiver domain-containing protein [Polaromonas sp. JS666]
MHRLRDSRSMQDSTSPTQVFLADDSALSRRRVAEMLTAQGMVVAGQADTPESAISGILAVRPDAVVLDVQFEKGTGLQVLRAVLKAAPGIPFIILSNHAEPAYRARYLAEGAACFLDKHTEFYQLAGQVKALAGLAAQPVSSL